MSATGYLCAVLAVLVMAQTYRLHVADVERQAFAERVQEVFDDSQDCAERLTSERMKRYQRDTT